MNVPVTEPKTIPMYVTTPQAKMTQMRCSVSNRSSILPATTMVGMAERTPEMSRQANTVGSDGRRVMVRHETAYKRLDER